MCALARFCWRILPRAISRGSLVTVQSINRADGRKRLSSETATWKWTRQRVPSSLLVEVALPRNRFEIFIFSPAGDPSTARLEKVAVLFLFLTKYSGHFRCENFLPDRNVEVFNLLQAHNIAACSSVSIFVTSWLLDPFQGSLNESQAICRPLGSCGFISQETKHCCPMLLSKL